VSSHFQNHGKWEKKRSADLFFFLLNPTWIIWANFPTEIFRVVKNVRRGIVSCIFWDWIKKCLNL
jgi:hypothetical protein